MSLANETNWQEHIEQPQSNGKTNYRRPNEKCEYTINTANL